MRLSGIVTYCSLADIASRNLAKYLGLETKPGRYETPYGYHVCVEGEFLYLPDVYEEFPIIFLSRHESASRYPALTVHATGNFGEAPYGGYPDKISISFPRLAGTLLKYLFELAPEGYHVNYEVTHHGPLVESPHVFIEIGSSETERNDKNAIEAVGEAVGRVLRELEVMDLVSAVGVGGPHYAPTFTRITREEPIGFGHIIPKRAMKGEPRVDRLKMAIERTRPKAELVVLDRKGMSGKRRQTFRRRLQNAIENENMSLKRERR